MGKRIVLELEGGLFLVIHLMIAGRLRWKAGWEAARKARTRGLHFPTGVLVLTEAGSKRRASIHLVAGEEALNQFERGGLEVLDSSVTEFAARLRQESHTLKRSLTDPRLFGGIGNAYSDEILHRAKLSPLAMSRLDVRLSPGSIARRSKSCRSGRAPPGADRRRVSRKVTAFRPEMAVHGRFRQPCPVCGAPVQRSAMPRTRPTIAHDARPTGVS